MHYTIVSFLFILASQAAAPPLPDTDIHIYELKSGPNGVELGTGRNVTNSPGYDNQPAFGPDGRSLLFSARRDGVQNDIYRHEFASGSTRRLTVTPRNEYSPRVDMDGTTFTVVQEEGGAIQEIRRFGMHGQSSSPVLQIPDMIGYYAFATPSIAYTFILGEPNTLQRIVLDSGQRTTIASDIGRCIQPLPGGSVSYVRIEDKQPVLYRIDADGSGDVRLFPLLPDTEGDYAWLPDGSGVFSTQGSSLYFRKLQSESWEAVADLKEIGTLSRLSVSPDGRMLAVVALRP